MNVLYLLIDGTAAKPAELVELQEREHKVETLDLSDPNVSYETVVKKIFEADKVIAW